MTTTRENEIAETKSRIIEKLKVLHGMTLEKETATEIRRIIDVLSNTNNQ
jgi:hypothetical protein